MARRFKDYYDADWIALMEGKLVEPLGEGAARTFAGDARRRLAEAGDPAFSARQDLFAGVLSDHLPTDYVTALSLLEGILGPPLEQAEGMFTHGWWLWPVGRYVEHHATRDAGATLRFTRELTRRFTGEFALRPLLAAQPDETLAELSVWAASDDVHVRRCASECMRVSLPWASRLMVAIEHFKEFRAVLDQLRADPETFVRKSVGNNLNDLMKLRPDLARTIMDAWEAELTEVGADEPRRAAATRWIIRHGTRSLRGKRSQA